MNHTLDGSPADAADPADPDIAAFGSALAARRDRTDEKGRIPMRRTTRHITAGVAATSLFALSACGGNGGDGANAWVLTGGAWPNVEADFDRWNEQADDEYQIDTESFENDAYKERIRTAVGSGEAPTMILSWAGGALLEYVEQDRLVDITDRVEGLESRIHESVWENGVVDGSTYAVPINDVQPAVLYYNEEVFDEVGAEVPTTWSEVEEVIETFNDNDITPFSLAGGSVWPALMWLQYLTDRHGGEEVFQAVVEGEEGAWEHESILYALETMQWLATEGGFDADTFTGVTADQNEDLRLLADGEAAMLLQLSSMNSSFEEDFPDFVDSGNLGFAEFPTIEEGDGDPSNIVGNPANFWSVSSDASEEEQEAARSYLDEHHYNDEVVADQLEAGSLPPLNDIDVQMSDSEHAEFFDFIYDAVENANHFQTSWDQAVLPEEEQPLIENVENILLGNITPEEFADNMNSL